jgi:pSer/pThr/pTyr-binding forkhead associated (FHA) protein
MALVTLRVLDGADRGRVFGQVPTPVTVGREEGNAVQLNDERVSRFHLKIQEDQDKIVLTDLESTNGTKVNGESTQLWILRPGDIIALGRTVLLFGSEEEIAQRLAKLHGADLSAGVQLEVDELDQLAATAALQSEFLWGDQPDAEITLHTLLPPELPDGLTPGQAAQLSELLQFLHLRLRQLIQSVKVQARSEQVILQQRQWQNLLDLQARLADYLRAVGEPEG